MTRNRISTSGALKRRGRLVHDEDARVARDGLGDLDQLLLADHQVFDFGARIDRRLQTFEESARLALLFGVVDPSRAHDLAIGEDVFRDRKIAEQVQLLEHHADAVRHRVGGVVEMRPACRRAECARPSAARRRRSS